MKKYKILILSFLVVILSAVVYAAAQLSVTPSTVNAGNPITISVTPTSAGVYKYAYIYRDNTYKASVAFPCSYYKCYSPTSTAFTIPSNWVNSDKYNVRVYDYSIYNYVRLYFTVIGGAEPRNATVTLSPTSLNVGEVLTINVLPGNDGVAKYAYIYDSLNNYKGNINFGCAAPCLNSITYYYTVPSSFASGVYSLWVYDYGAGSYIKSYFLVNSSSLSCADTDGGINQYTKGTVISSTANLTDSCVDSLILTEYYCNSAGNASYINMNCGTNSTTCVDGACTF